MKKAYIDKGGALAFESGIPKAKLAEAGYVDLGFVAIHREKLKLLMPVFDRFERWLPLAMEASEYITAHEGAIPPWLARHPCDRSGYAKPFR